MTVKDYLGQVKVIDVKIDQKLEQLRELRAKAVGSGQAMSPDKVQTSLAGDKTARIVEECVDLEAEIYELLVKYIRVKGHIIDQIHMLSDGRYVELLYMKYIRYMRLEEISCTMKKRNGEPYSFDHIAALHGEALKEFSKIVKILEIP